MKDKFENKNFNREEFLRKLDESHDNDETLEIESLFDKESQEGWALVKNQSEREKSLDEQFFKIQLSSQQKKSQLKNAAPWVAIAASLLLLIGLFTFFKEQLNNKEILSEKGKNKSPLNEKIIDKKQENYFSPSDSNTKKIAEIPRKNNQTSKESVKTSLLTKNSNLHENDIASIQEKSVVISDLNAGNSLDSDKESSEESIASYDNVAAEGVIPVTETLEENLPTKSSEKKEEKPKEKKSKLRSKDHNSPASAATTNENSISVFDFYFSGGDEALSKFILDNRRSIPTLRSTYLFKVKISINKKSKAKFIEIINPNDCEECKSEIIRLVELLPKWENSKKTSDITEEVHEIIIELSRN